MNKQIVWIAALAIAAFGTAAEAQTITAVYTTYSANGVPTKLDITGTAFCTTTPCGTKAPVVRLAGNIVAISGSSPTGIGVPLTGQPDGDYLLSVTPSGKSAINYAFTLKSKTGGATGPQGPIGPVGPAGPQGPQGLQGTKGDTGAAGADGAPGVQGPVGVTGPQGPQGAQGPMGLQGPKGDKGDTGPQGVSGANGAPGSFPNATTVGAILVWDGGKWVEIPPPASPGVGLLYCSNGPVWAAICAPPAPLLFFSENFGAPTLDSLKLEDPNAAFQISNGRIRRTVKGPVGDGSNRRYVRTVRTDYNTSDWIFQIKYHAPPNAGDDMIFVGFGEGISDTSFYNESRNSANFRIHQGLTGASYDWGVDAVIHTVGPFVWPVRKIMGRVANASVGGSYQLSVCKKGPYLKFTLSDGASLSLVGEIQDFSIDLPNLDATNSRLFFGNANGEFEYSDFSVAPLSGSCP